MLTEASWGSGDPMSFNALGKVFPKLPKNKKPKFTVRMSEFAKYGFCWCTAWHLSKGTKPVLAPRAELARSVGKIVHDELDKKHEKKIADLPKVTEKTRLDKYKPLAFSRNFSVDLYHKSFLYVGRIDNLCRKSDGNFYITEDKTISTYKIPYYPYLHHRLQVWAYCAGLASKHRHRYNARHIWWQIQYRNRIGGDILGKFGSFYDAESHKTLLESLNNFEEIYQGKGDDPGFGINPKKCEICIYKDECQFKTRI